MPLVLVRTTCESLVCPACVEALRTGVSTVGAALVLVPSFDVALRVQKAVAHEDGLGLGVDVSTPASWVEDMWELWGDGRRLVTADMRRLLVAQVLGQETDAACSPSLTPGVVGLLCDLAARLPPLAGEGEGKLTQGEMAAIASLRSYYNVLDQRGLMEPAHAMCAMRDLLGKTAVSLPPVVLMGFTTLAHAERELVVGLAELTRVIVVQRLFSSVADEAGEALVRELTSVAADAGIVVEEEWEEGPVRSRTPELAAVVQTLFEPSRPRVVPTGAVCLLEPSGPLAEAELVTRELQRLAREGARTMVVCVPDPRMAWRTLAPKLVARGLSVEADLAIRVLDCEAGRSFMGYARSVADLACLDAVWPEPEQGADGMLACLGDMSWWPPQELVDFLLCEVAHVDASRARALDVAWRSDRLLSPGGVLAQLTSAKATSVPVERATRELLKGRLGSAASKLLAPFAPGRGDATTLFREESMAALAAVLDVAGTLKELGVTANPSAAQAVSLATLVDLAELVLSNKRVIVRPRVSGGEGAPLVRMATRAQAASLEPASVDVLVACGLTSHDYAVPSADDVLNAILEALCVERPLDPLVNQRVEFARLCSLASSRLLAERPLFSVDAKETYPAVMLTELDECYATDLPRIRRAENLACENVSNSGEALHPCAKERFAPSGSIDPALRRLVTVPQEGVAELEGWLPVLSASQLESYLECPLKWFSLRRLRLVDNDAGFGPLEMGTFAHRVLELARMQLLDEALTAQGIMPGEPFDLSRRLPGSRVEVGTPASLEHAREVLGHTFDVHAEHQRIRTGGHAAFQALVPHVVRELSQMDTLRRDLLSTLDFEAGRLQGFEPRLLEWKFGGRDNPMRYAGVCVTGTVDRVDVNAHGQALVIDYKHKGPSGFFAEYAAFPNGGRKPDEPLVLPRRIQSLLYAQVVRRAFPQLEVVGALYLGTRGTHELSGVVAEAQEDLVFGKTLSARRHQRVCVSRSDTFGLEEGAGMDALLDACEQAVAAAVERLSSGDIEARPIDASACAYCPVLSCERRMRA